MSTVFGMANLQAKLARLTAGADVIADAARESLAEDIANDARSFVNVETGALRDSIRVEDGNVVAGSSTVDYADAQEFAFNGQPYMRPAADGSVRHVPEAAGKAKAFVEGLV